MPDLSKQTVLTWLGDQDTGVATLWGGPIRSIEDDADVRSALTELGEVLDNSFSKDAGGLSITLQEEACQTRLRRILVQLGTARLFRLLGWFSTAGLPEGDKVVSGLLQDEPTGAGQMLRSAAQELQRQELLTRLFSRSRLETLVAACQVQKPEAA